MAPPCVDHLQPFLGNGGGAVHHQVGVGDGFVDLSDAADGQHFTVGLRVNLSTPWLVPMAM